ncbi:MAG: epoxyqueuosine reductase QueH [Candidatus Omnitrophota bacterium]
MTAIKTVLLHACCAPCSTYVNEWLMRDYAVTCFFYNPNIHPVDEYRFRETEMERIARIKNWKVVYGDPSGQDVAEWFRLVRGHEADPERGERCSICFHMRLKKTFEYARSNAIDAVTTTLSVSPYKVTRQINAQGEALSREFGVRFLAENFKKQNGFNTAKKMAMELGIQYQDYCGCVFSLAEKESKKYVSIAYRRDGACNVSEN